MNEKGIKKILTKIISVLSYVCLTILVLIAVFLLYYIISNQIARVKGTKPLISLYTIVSPSMEPNINVYDVIIDIRVNKDEDIKLGDVITFYSDSIDTGGYTVTHRIHSIYDTSGTRYYITKGDNNQNPDDGTITISNIVGKVKYVIPGLGRIQFFVSSKFGWIIVILIPAIGIILADIKKLIKIFRIKEQIEEIPKLKEVEIIREKEEDKKLRAVVEEANKLNKR